MSKRDIFSADKLSDRGSIERITNHQIELKRHIDSQATKLLSIWLTFIGIFITLGIAVASGQLSIEQTGNSLMAFDLFEIAESADYLTIERVRVMMYSSAIFGVICVIYTVINLFLMAPRNALKILQSDSPHPVIPEAGMEKPDVLESNQEIVNSVEGRWGQCLSALERGLYSLGITFLLLIITFVYFHPTFLVIVFSSIFLLITYYTNIYFDDIRSKLRYGNILFLLYAISIFGTFLLAVGVEEYWLPDEVLVIFYLVVFTISLFSAIVLAPEEVFRFIAGSLVVTVLSFIFLIILADVFGPTPDPTLAHEVVDYVFLSIIFTTAVMGLATVSIGAGRLTFEVLERVRELISKSSIVNRS